MKNTNLCVIITDMCRIKFDGYSIPADSVLLLKG